MSDNTCPLHGCTRVDSTGHILGGCLHAEMTKLYIARHDAAARKVIKAIREGAHGSYCMIADVGTKDILWEQFGIQNKRILTWLISDEVMAMDSYGFDPDALGKFTPDVLNVEGLNERDVGRLKHDRAGNLELEPTMTECIGGEAKTTKTRPRRVWILEIGYCTDTRYEKKYAMKLAQHATLIALLQHAGYEPINLPVVLGTQGSVYKSIDVALKAGILSKTRRGKSSPAYTHMQFCA